MEMDLADEATVKAVVLLAATSLDPAAMAAEVTARIVAASWWARWGLRRTSVRGVFDGGGMAGSLKREK